MVNTEPVPDHKFQVKLQQEIVDNRIGYVSVFDYLTVNVEMASPPSTAKFDFRSTKQTALAAVNNTEGVKGVVDEIRVSPASHR